MMPRENTRRASYMQGKQRTHTFRRKSTKKFPTAHAIPAFYFVLSLTRTTRITCKRVQRPCRDKKASAPHNKLTGNRAIKAVKTKIARRETSS